MSASEATWLLIAGWRVSNHWSRLGRRPVARKGRSLLSCRGRMIACFRRTCRETAHALATASGAKVRQPLVTHGAPPCFERGTAAAELDGQKDRQFWDVLQGEVGHTMAAVSGVVGRQPLVGEAIAQGWRHVGWTGPFGMPCRQRRRTLLWPVRLL